MNKPAVPCSICKRPLTDPVSIALGIGPVCRITKKQKAAKMKQSENLFGSGVDYSFDITGNVLHIKDNNGAVSVTNAIDRVLTEIWESGVDIRAHNVIYRDSDGIWDGVHFVAMLHPATENIQERREVKGIRFYAITEKDLALAIEKAREAKNEK